MERLPAFREERLKQELQKIPKIQWWRRIQSKNLALKPTNILPSPSSPKYDATLSQIVYWASTAVRVSNYDIFFHWEFQSCSTHQFGIVFSVKGPNDRPPNGHWHSLSSTCAGNNFNRSRKRRFWRGFRNCRRLLPSHPLLTCQYLREFMFVKCSC